MGGPENSTQAQRPELNHQSDLPRKVLRSFSDEQEDGELLALNPSSRWILTSRLILNFHTSRDVLN